MDGIYDKFSKEARAPSSSSSVIPTDAVVGTMLMVVIGGDTTVVGATVAGALVTGALVTGGFVTGGLVTGALVTGGFVTGAVVTVATGVGGRMTGGDVDGGVVVVVVVPPLPPKPDTRNVMVPVPDTVMSVMVIPVVTIFPF